MILDETADRFGSMALTNPLFIAVTLAYVISYGCLILNLIKTWRLKREMS